MEMTIVIVLLMMIVFALYQPSWWFIAIIGGLIGWGGWSLIVTVPLILIVKGIGTEWEESDRNKQAVGDYARMNSIRNEQGLRDYTAEEFNAVMKNTSEAEITEEMIARYLKNVKK